MNAKKIKIVKIAETAKIAEITDAAKISEVAETEIVNFLKTFKNWVFLKKWMGFSEKTWFSSNSLKVAKLL